MLGLRSCVRVRVLVSVTGSVSYLNEKFLLFLAFVALSVECQYFNQARTVNSHCSVEMLSISFVRHATRLISWGIIWPTRA